MPCRASAVARQGARREAAASALASAMMSGVTPVALIGEQLAGAADAGLHLVEDSA
jgi:hypothetical protein